MGARWTLPEVRYYIGGCTACAFNMFSTYPKSSLWLISGRTPRPVTVLQTKSLAVNKVMTELFETKNYTINGVITLWPMQASISSYSNTNLILSKKPKLINFRPVGGKIVSMIFNKGDLTKILIHLKCKWSVPRSFNCRTI